MGLRVRDIFGQVYLTHGQLPIHDYPHNPASLFTQWTDIALRLYALSGNASWVAKAEGMLAYHLANGMTPNASSWAWPGVPFASSDAGDRLYRGSAQGNVSGKGDGVGVIEVDKVSPIDSSKALRVCPSHRTVV